VTDDTVYQTDRCTVETGSDPGEMVVRTSVAPDDREAAVRVDATELQAALRSHLRAVRADGDGHPTDRRAEALGCGSCGFVGSVTGRAAEVQFCPACGDAL
jgi:hypothetical protein